MRRVSPDPRMSDASPAQLAEAFIDAMGWSHGSWSVELVVQDGVVRKAHAKSSSGRDALLERRLPSVGSDAV